MAVSSDSLATAQNIFMNLDAEDNTQANANFGGFRSGTGKSLAVSSDSLAKAKAIFTNLEKEDNTQANANFGGFRSGTGKSLAVSSDSLAKAKAIFTNLEKEDNTQANANFSGFRSGTGKSLAVSSDSLAKAKAIFTNLEKEDNTQANANFSGFRKATGKSLAVSSASLAKAQALFTSLDTEDTLHDGSDSTPSNAPSASKNGMQRSEDTTPKFPTSKLLTSRRRLANTSPPKFPRLFKKADDHSPCGPSTVSKCEDYDRTWEEAIVDCPPIIVPINSVVPFQVNWCIRARVTKKYAIRTYHNSRGEGKLFSVDLADESGEMRATGFNQECDKYFLWLKEGAVYYIRGGQVKMANRQYTSIDNEYELTFNSATLIEPCFDDRLSQLPVTFNFVKLDKLSPDLKDKVIDVIGVVDLCSQCQTISSRKTNQELKKRDVRLVDDSLASISLTMWGAEAELFENEGHPVLAIKGVRVSAFNGVSLSTTSSSQQHLSPDIPEAHRLRGWYDSQVHDAPIKSLSSAGGPANTYIPIALAESDRLGSGDIPDYYRVKAFISNVRRDNCLYKACPASECNRKLIDQGTGRYRCESCNKEYDIFKWRLMLQVTITDFSGSQQITLFNQQAEQLIGMKSKDLQDLRERSEEDFNTTMRNVLFKQCSFHLRAKMDLYNHEMRLKVTCQQLEDIDVNAYCKFLTEEIDRMEALPDKAVGERSNRKRCKTDHGFLLR